MIRPIYLYGAEVLRKKATEVDLKDKEGIASLVQDLKDTLVTADGPVIISETFFALGPAGFLAVVFGDFEDFFDFSESADIAVSASVLSFIFS